MYNNEVITPAAKLFPLHAAHFKEYPPHHWHNVRDAQRPWVQSPSITFTAPSPSNSLESNHPTRMHRRIRPHQMRKLWINLQRRTNLQSSQAFARSPLSVVAGGDRARMVRWQSRSASQCRPATRRARGRPGGRVCGFWCWLGILGVAGHGYGALGADLSACDV